MAEGPLVRREDALKVAAEVMLLIDDLTDLYEVAGSIRRKSPMVHDCDLVVIPKSEALQVPNEFGVEPVTPWDKRIKEIIDIALKENPNQEVKQGDKMINFTLHGVSVDIYIATEETFECLLLIKTGSAAHNRMLASVAKSKGWKLHGSGEGLEDLSTKEIIARTEKDIMEKLIGVYKEPEYRN